MHEPPRRSPLIPLARIAALVAIGDLMTKQVALLWVGTLEPRVSSAVRFGVVHNDKGAFGLTVGDYTWEVSLALTLAALVLIMPVARDLSRVDDRAPTALGLVAGGAIGNLVSLLLSPAGVVDFIAIQRADGAGIVLNVADVAAYAGVVMLMRTTAMVILAIRRNRPTLSRASCASSGTSSSHGSRMSKCSAVAHAGGKAIDATGCQTRPPPRQAARDRSPTAKSICESFTRTARPIAEIADWRRGSAIAMAARASARGRRRISDQCLTADRVALEPVAMSNPESRSTRTQYRRDASICSRAVVILASHGRQAHDRARRPRRRAHPPSHGRRDRRAVRRNRQSDSRWNPAARRSARATASPTFSMSASR